MTEEETKYLEWFDSKPKLGFSMFTNAGNKKCKQITVSSIKKVFSNAKITKEQLLEHIGKRIGKVMKKPAYEEITDSEPPYVIKQYVMKAVKIAGYNWEFDAYDVSEAAYKFKTE
tara:strand:+ start:1770 stop:2114 length:345 start_codon:yes stop_codon:yes gene_type:complete